ncbi:hypothetical protein O1L68_02600 [Streptomyces lydicus]|nr:hypothetical protein [Streptomyces lydicus]
MPFGGERGLLVEVGLGDRPHDPLPGPEQIARQLDQRGLLARPGGVPQRLPQHPHPTLCVVSSRGNGMPSSARWAARSRKTSKSPGVVRGSGSCATRSRNSRSPCRAVAAISTSLTSAGSSA